MHIVDLGKGFEDDVLIAKFGAETAERTVLPKVGAYQENASLVLANMMKVWHSLFRGLSPGGFAWRGISVGKLIQG